MGEVVRPSLRVLKCNNQGVLKRCPTWTTTHKFLIYDTWENCEEEKKYPAQNFNFNKVAVPTHEGVRTHQNRRPSRPTAELTKTRIKIPMELDPLVLISIQYSNARPNSEPFWFFFSTFTLVKRDV